MTSSPRCWARSALEARDARSMRLPSPAPSHFISACDEHVHVTGVYVQRDHTRRLIGVDDAHRAVGMRQVCQRLHVEPEASGVLHMRNADGCRVLVHERRHFLERQAPGVIRDVDHPQLHAGFLGNADPRERRGRNLHVDQDDVLPFPRSQPPRHLRDRLGDGPHPGDIGGLRAVQSRSCFVRIGCVPLDVRRRELLTCAARARRTAPG